MLKKISAVSAPVMSSFSLGFSSPAYLAATMLAIPILAQLTYLNRISAQAHLYGKKAPSSAAR